MCIANSEPIGRVVSVGTARPGLQWISRQPINHDFIVPSSHRTASAWALLSVLQLLPVFGPIRAPLRRRVKFPLALSPHAQLASSRLPIAFAFAPLLGPFVVALISRLRSRCKASSMWFPLEGMEHVCRKEGTRRVCKYCIVLWSCLWTVWVRAVAHTGRERSSCMATRRPHVPLMANSSSSIDSPILLTPLPSGAATPITDFPETASLPSLYTDGVHVVEGEDRSSPQSPGVAERVRALECRMSRGSVPPHPPTNTRRREEHGSPVTTHPAVRYGHVLRPSLFVANPDCTRGSDGA